MRDYDKKKSRLRNELDVTFLTGVIDEKSVSYIAKEVRMLASSYLTCIMLIKNNLIKKCHSFLSKYRRHNEIYKKCSWKINS